MSRPTQRTVLVIGASGLVGQAVVRAGVLAGHTVFGTSRWDPDPKRRVDLRDVASIRRAIVETARPPDVVIIAAAVSSVESCEANPAATYDVNVAGSRAVAEAAAEAEAKVVFVSSDYVFGDGGPHLEGDDPAPMNEYGRQKLETEHVVLGRSNVVVRTCQVFGQDARRANFMLATVDRLAAGEFVHAHTELFGTPTYVRDLAGEIVDLATGTATGVWHVAGPDFLSRFELAQHIARTFDFDVGRILAAETISGEVPRPLKAGLRSTRGRPPLRSVDAGLAALVVEEQSTS